MHALVSSAILGGFFGSIVSITLAFCLRSGRGSALAALAIFSAAMGLAAAIAVISGEPGWAGIVAPVVLLLAVLAFVTRRTRLPLPGPAFAAAPDAAWLQTGLWPSGGGNQFGGACPFGGGDAAMPPNAPPPNTPPGSAR